MVKDRTETSIPSRQSLSCPYSPATLPSGETADVSAQ